MPLIKDLEKTSLKSLKYGHDSLDGGDSGQPYIKTDINNVDTGINRLRFSKFDDGLIRGGAIGAIGSSLVDTIRISKFLTDLPRGPLFIVKQIGLQLSNPRLEIPRNPINVAAGGVNNILSVSTNGLLQPTRIYNLGINTLLQVPINAFGGHSARHGLLPSAIFPQSDDSKYEAIATANNNDQFLNDPSKNNRLVRLAASNKFDLGYRKVSFRPTTLSSGAGNFLSNLAGAANSLFGLTANLNPVQLTIDDYFGGPGSTYGIGNTTIRRSTLGFTQDSFLIKKSIEQSYKQTDINYYDVLNSFGPSKQYFVNDQGLAAFSEGADIDVNRPFQKPNGIDLTTYSKVAQKAVNIDQTSVPRKLTPLKDASYATYKKILESRKLTEIHYTSGSNNVPVNEFGLYGNNSPKKGVVGVGVTAQNVLPDATTYPVYRNPENKIVRIKLPWNEITREKRVGSGAQDAINLTPIFGSSNGKRLPSYWADNSIKIPGKVGTNPDGSFNIRDLAKFIIQAVDTDSPNNGEWMVFRAYITDFSDSVDASWNSVKYAGRGDSFHIYNGFTRKIGISFKVAALSAEEMKPMYQKLNFLMSNLMPDYKDNLLMRGPLVRMTVGNYFDAQLGKLDSLSYKVPQDSPWEIALDEPEGGVQLLILPHIIEVTLGFTPIGSETGVSINGSGSVSNQIPQKSQKISNLAQNTTGFDVGTLQYIE